MQHTPPTRKRPAPDASPMMQQPTVSQANHDYLQQMPQTTDFNNFDFNQFGTDQVFSDPMTFDLNTSATSTNTAQPVTHGENSLPSTDLVRRTQNQQLAPHIAQQQQQWNGQYAMDNAQPSPQVEDEQELDRKVQLAKRDAQGKRKQIPPFVQKLSSFLDSGNTDLIRWSEDGRSFIVIDEDEFARTLIPELFKHNRYASFVRQLNMYGFHKTVNITDGSLRQSEEARKGVKPPSMYSHPYFRRNRPDLLWLIQKPISKNSAKRKQDETAKGEFDSDDERAFSPVPDGRPGGELGMTGNQNVAALPRNELKAVRRELQNLQTQQRFISEMITQLTEQNDAFYRQASAFQALHDRHENSINAILTFLATFYNRSLEGHGVTSLVDMFSNLPKQSNQHPHGSVVEDFTDIPVDNANQLPRFKRQPLRLPAPEPARAGNQNLLPGSAATAPTSARSSMSPPSDNRIQRDSTSSAQPDITQPHPTETTSPPIKTDAPTPKLLNQLPESDQMMSLINSVNATNASTPTTTTAPTLDFSSALSHYQTANGSAPLTPQQRDDVLALMANQQQPGTDAGASSRNNALVSPQPPSMPDLDQYKRTQDQLERLTQMQRRQDEKVQELNRRLQPLSPTGAIPGLADEENYFDVTGGPGEFDPDQFINLDDEGEEFQFDTGGSGDGGGSFEWDLEGGNDGAEEGMFLGTDGVGLDGGGGLAPPVLAEGLDGGGVGGRVDSVSSAATSPAGTLLGDGGGEDPGTPSKRRRME